MPKFDAVYPPGCTSIKLLDDNNDEYGVYISSDTFLRVGEDGSEITLPIFHGDEFVGTVLEGHWRKGWTTDMDADQPFTAILDGAGILEMEGEADVAGTIGYGWINSNNIIPLLNDTEITFACILPTDDTGSTADRDIYWYFTLLGTESAAQPTTLRDSLGIYAWVDESGIMFYLRLRRDALNSTLWSGSDYSGAARTTGDLEATIWRLVFHGKPGSTGSHFHVYLKQSDTLANAELADEHELSDSPFSSEEFGFNTCFPSLQIASENTSYFDSGAEMKWDYIRLTYPNGFSSKYDCPDANLHLGEVELWDDTIRVYDEDHDFTGLAAYLQNGLVKLKLTFDNQYGLIPYVYLVGGWTAVGAGILPTIEAGGTTITSYLINLSIVLLSTERTVIRVRLANSATHDTDYYMDFLITLLRGSYQFEMQVVDVYPQNSISFCWYTLGRFGWDGENNGLGDDDMLVIANNTALLDNFLLAFDDDGDARIACIAASMKPNWDETRFQAYRGGNGLYIDDYYYSTAFENKFFIIAVPFSLIANTFVEAETIIYGGATDVVDAAASAGRAALLNAQNEYVEYRVNAGTHFPAGRYIAVFRVRDINQVASDLDLRVLNNTDTEYRNEEHAEVYHTVTALYAYYAIVFDITDEDATALDQIYIRALKSTATANEIYVDYITVVPIGDGLSFPQDIAHRCMREGKVVRRVFER